MQSEAEKEDPSLRAAQARLTWDREREGRELLRHSNRLIVNNSVVWSFITDGGCNKKGNRLPNWDRILITSLSIPTSFYLFIIFLFFILTLLFNIGQREAWWHVSREEWANGRSAAADLILYVILFSLEVLFPFSGAMYVYCLFLDWMVKPSCSAYLVLDAFCL